MCRALLVVVAASMLPGSVHAGKATTDDLIRSAKLLEIRSEDWIQSPETDVLGEFGEPKKRKRDRQGNVRRIVYTAPVFGEVLSAPGSSDTPSFPPDGTREDPTGPGPDPTGAELTARTFGTASAVGRKVTGKVTVVFTLDDRGRISGVDRTVRYKRSANRPDE